MSFYCVSILTNCQLAVLLPLRPDSLSWFQAHPDTRPISFTYPPMASMWVVTLHNLLLYSDPPLTCHSPSYWRRLFSSQNFFPYKYPNIFKPSHPSYLSAYEDGTECSETSAYKIQTPRKLPRKKHKTFRTWRRFEIKSYSIFILIKK